MPRIKQDQVGAPADNLDDEIFSGGPGNSSPADDGQPDEGVQDEELVPVKINGIEYRVDRAMAAALEDREKDFQRKLSEQADDLRRRYVQPVQQQPVREEEENLDVLLFENPKDAIAKLENRIVKRVVAAYQADQGEKEFWGAFYREHPDLSKHDRIARAILNERFNEWAHLPTASARRELASAVREEILSILNAHKPEDARGKRRTFVEGGGAPRQPQRQEAPSAPRTLSDMIASRRQSHLKGPAARK